MFDFNPDTCRFIKNRQHCWEVYNDEGEKILTSHPNLPKDAVKSSLKFAITCYNAGFAAGQKSDAFEEGKQTGIKLGQSDMKTKLRELLINAFPEQFENK
ncbi:hypothetical protein [Vibrio owensii]|uniref:hypothetical protein n=1 Tax=Vibrio owensii TaxID=696485 RepID=UPI0018F1C527|nr:hypothetical protein [Vibrio owensii]